MTFRAYYDGVQKITVELDLGYYNGMSAFFKVIDGNNRVFEATIIKEEVLDKIRTYTLRVMGLTIGGAYQVVDAHFLKTPLVYRYVVRSEAFDEMFYYHGHDLGNHYSKEKTLFKVWTPVASRVWLDLKGKGTYDMQRSDKGVFELEVLGDLEGVSYQYLIESSGSIRAASDPYAYTSQANNGLSLVIDLERTQVDLCKDRLPQLEKKTQSIIYEVHVRDFSSKGTSGIQHRGKYLGMIEEGTQNTNGDATGFDYLTSLGITHVQLLPIYDFGSVDELNPFDQYNWGYDPVQYNVPEGSYATDASHAYARIVELKQMVARFHEKGLRLVMDVVYNHMFDRFSSAFEALVPYYYFRIGDQGEISNGSFCGNDMDSTRLMVRKYILDSIERWMRFYGMDGFRFDLMGILDIETMNQVADLVEAIDPNALVYGEGWDMPTLMASDQRASLLNQSQMPKIGHFNDVYRDAIKGGTQLEQVTEKGILTGNLKSIHHLPLLLMGTEYTLDQKHFLDAPTKSINYVACHDNHTLYDKMVLSQVPEDEILVRHRLIMATLLFSQGIPFIHAGQEFLRSKNGDHNSYLSSDLINGIDWDLVTTHKDQIRFVKEAIDIRKSFAEFQVETYDHTIKGRVKKTKKLVEMTYPSGLKLVINLGNQSRDISLKKGNLIFNGQGKCLIEEKSYALSPLELILIQAKNT